MTSFAQTLKRLLRKGRSALEKSEEHIDAIEQKACELVDEARRAGERVKNQAESLKTSSGTLEDSAQAKFREISNDLEHIAERMKRKAEEISDRVKEVTKAEAAGRYLTVNVLSFDDEMLAARGDMITHELLRKAEAAGKLSHVLRHTSKAPLT